MLNGLLAMLLPLRRGPTSGHVEPTNPEPLPAGPEMCRPRGLHERQWTHVRELFSKGIALARLDELIDWNRVRADVHRGLDHADDDWPLGGVWVSGEPEPECAVRVLRMGDSTAIRHAVASSGNSANSLASMVRVTFGRCFDAGLDQVHLGTDVTKRQAQSLVDASEWRVVGRGDRARLKRQPTPIAGGLFPKGVRRHPA